MEVVLSEAVSSGAEGRHDNRQMGEADTIRLEEQYESLPFPDYPAWWQPAVAGLAPCYGPVAGFSRIS